MLNESVKSTAQTAGKTPKTDFLGKCVQRQIRWVQTYRKNWTSRLPNNFYFPSKNLTNLERRFHRVPFQYSQVVAFACMTADIMSSSASSSSTKPNDFLSTDNSLFSSGNDSDSVKSKENGTPAAPKQVPTGPGAGGGGGLFDDEDEDEDDDFFGGRSLKKSDSGKCVRVGTSALQSEFSWDPCPQTTGCFSFFFSWTGETQTEESC